MGENHKHSMNKKVNETAPQENKIVIKKETPMHLEYKQESTEKQRMSVFKKVVFSTVIITALLVATVLGYTKHLLGYINTKTYDQDNNKVIMQEEKFEADENDKQSKAEKINPDEVKWNNSGDIKKVKGVTNLLLIADDDRIGERGRSDAIMIATINSNDKTLKLTSIMRDTYVQIPGCSDNRISAAYSIGDVPLLQQTIEKNFNISMDGYVKVSMAGFANIIDILGGVETTLTQAEVDWLNSGKHIMDSNSRNVKTGTHTLNGSQALAYCSIRKVSTVDGLQNDFGRIWRQKLVLTTVFNKYKDISINKIIAIAPDILSNITTDLPENKILSLAMTAFDLEVNEIQTLTIPVKGSYEDRTIRHMIVLVPNLKSNIAALDSFIYGESKKESSVVAEDEVKFSLTESNFKLKSIDRNTEKAFDALKGYNKLSLGDIRSVETQCRKN